jgi:hypothetical protein
MQLLSDTDLAEQLRARSTALAQLHAEQVTLSARILAETSALDDVRAELRRRELTVAQAAARGVDWPVLLQEGNGRALHKERERVLQAMGLASAGFFPDTLQRCLCIMMHRDCDGEVAALADSLDVVMPHLLPVDGWCALKVLEHRESGDCYHLRFRPDRSQYQVVNLRLRAPDVELATADLRAALAHIQRHHFYDDAPRGS